MIDARAPSRLLFGALCAMAILFLAGTPGSAAAAGQLAVRDAWARATPPGAGAAAVYLTVVGGTAADRLVRVSTTRASMAQVHSVTTAAGVSSMREVDGVPIPAGREVVFAPQGLHIMLMGLTSGLAAGGKFTLTLEFAQAGRRDVTVQVVAPTATGPAAH